VLRISVRTAAFLLAVWLLAVQTPAAWAHASLLATDPPDGAVLPKPPPTATMHFNEPVAPIFFRLIAPDGAATELTKIEASDNVVRLVLPASMATGTYLVSWRVTSADGHPVGGSFVFAVGAPSAPPRAEQAALSAVHCLLWFAKLNLYFGLFVGVGGAFAGALLMDRGRMPRIVERAVFSVIFIGIGATAGHVCLQGLDVLDRPLSDGADAEVWRAGLSGGAGLFALLALLALGLALGSLTAKQGRRTLAATAMVAVGGALASTGHAASAPPESLTRPAVFLHAIGVAFWIGALLPLAELFRAEHAARQVALQRFSRAIPWILILLIVAGAVLAVIQLRALPPLWTTAYGIILCCKLGAVVALLAIAAWNRYHLSPLLQAGDGAAISRFARSVGLELLLVGAILALVAGWRFTPPPRTLEGGPQATLDIHLHGADATAEIEASFVRGALTTIVVRPKKGGAPLDAQQVTLLLDDPRQGLEPIRRIAERQADGVWQVSGLSLPRATLWRVRIDILVSDFKQIRLEGEIAP